MTDIGVALRCFPGLSCLPPTEPSSPRRICRAAMDEGIGAASRDLLERRRRGSRAFQLRGWPWLRPAACARLARRLPEPSTSLRDRRPFRRPHRGNGSRTSIPKRSPLRGDRSCRRVPRCGRRRRRRARSGRSAPSACGPYWPITPRSDAGSGLGRTRRRHGRWTDGALGKLSRVRRPSGSSISHDHHPA